MRVYVRACARSEWPFPTAIIYHDAGKGTVSDVHTGLSAMYGEALFPQDTLCLSAFPGKSPCLRAQWWWGLVAVLAVVVVMRVHVLCESGGEHEQGHDTCEEDMNAAAMPHAAMYVCVCVCVCV